MIRSILSKVFGTLFFLIIKRKRKVALQNIDYIYGNTLSSYEKRKMALTSFCHGARTLLDVFLPSKDIEQEFTFEEGSYRPESKKHYIFFGGHFGNWEMASQFLAKQFPNGSCLVRPFKPAWLNSILNKRRTRWGGHLIDRNKGMLTILRRAKQASIITIADQSVLMSDFSYPFLGKRSWISTALALIALKVKVPIVVCTSRREKGKLLIHFSQPIWPQEIEDRKARIHDYMYRVIQEYERQVKKAPEQFMWMHRQWKQEKVYFKKKSLGIREVHLLAPKKHEMQAQTFQDYFSRCTFKTFLDENAAIKETSKPQLVLDFSHSKKLKKYYRCPVVVIPPRDDWNSDKIYAFFKAQHVTH
jgi:Kdo2-lipid IVA lauroyltransferase/acyltransferase